MQLPYGTLASSHKGSADLKEMGEAIAKDAVTGYLRVSVFDGNAVRESVIVYSAGKPVMAFVSDGTADRKDPEYRQMEEAIRKDNAIVEICKLQDKHVKLLQDLYRDFAIAPAAAAGPKPAPREPPKAAALRPEAKPRAAPVPEVRGRFVRAEDVGDLHEYLQKHPGETGHLLFMARHDGRLEEDHIILIKGRIEAAYNGNKSGLELLEKLTSVPGQAEFYSVDEGLLTSIVGRYTRSASPATPAREKHAPGIGIPAKELLEGSRPAAASARGDISRAVNEISGGMEDDVAMMRKVEHEFASHVDELLSKLELSHLRSRKKK